MINNDDWTRYREDVSEYNDRIYVATSLTSYHIAFTCDAHRECMVSLVDAMHDYEEQGCDWDDRDTNWYY